MDFVTSHFRKMKLWPVEHFSNILLCSLERIIFSSNQKIGEGESNFDDKYVEKTVQLVFNWSEFHLSEMTCYKIHTLDVFVCLFLNQEYTLYLFVSWHKSKNFKGEEISKAFVLVDNLKVLLFFFIRVFWRNCRQEKDSSEIF